MSSEDSFMDIVRERLYTFDFLEAQGKPGLFFNKFLVEGMTFYVDMRKNPMRMYGYKNIEASRDVALEQEYVDKMLDNVKKSLVSVGCDLTKHGFENLGEQQWNNTGDPEKAVITIYNILTPEQQEEVKQEIRLYDEAFARITMKEDDTIGIDILDPKIVMVTTTPKKKTVDTKFF